MNFGKSTTTRTRALIGCAAAAAFLAGAPSRAQESEHPVTIHAAGGSIFGVTNGPNSYLGGAPDRSLDLHELSLTAMATPTDRLLIGAQVYWGVRNIYEPHDLELNLNMAFAQYKVSDELKIRAGQSRQPFGLYSETPEIGTLRPFLHLPQSIYVSSTFQAEGYRGLGLTGSVGFGPSWSFDYDVYGGELVWASATKVNPVLAALGGDAPAPRWKDTIGGRVRLTTPVEGLRAGFAVVTGTPREGFLGEPIHRQLEDVVSIEYERGPFVLRTEWAYRDTSPNLWCFGEYVEASYQLTPHWQIAARWDQFDGEWVPTYPIPPFIETATHHRDLAFGVAYRPVSGLVFKASYHDVYGNLLSVPAEGVDFFHGGSLVPRTRLFELGVQFSF